MSDPMTANIRDLLKHMAKYTLVPPTLADGDAHNLTLTSDGKLRVDDPTTQAAIQDIEDKLDHATHGLEALRVLLAAIPTTPELEADAATRYTALAAYVDEVESLLKNATYGLSALKTWMDARPTERGTDAALLAASYVTERGTDSAELESDAATRYGVIGGYVDGIESLLENVTYGLAALKAMIDIAQADLDSPDQYKANVAALALEATLTAIKGGGWTDETLVALKAWQDARAAERGTDNALLAASYTAERGTDSSELETDAATRYAAIIAAIAAITGGATAAQVWAYATRVLTDVYFKNYALSNDVMHSHDATVTETTNHEVWTKKKTITLDRLRNDHASPPTTATIRTYFQLRCSTGTHSKRGKIYKGGVAVGTERVTSSSSFQAYSEDLEFTEGDTCELWGYNYYVPEQYQLRYFRILGTYARAGSMGTPMEGTNS